MHEPDEGREFSVHRRLLERWLVAPTRLGRGYRKVTGLIGLDQTWLALRAATSVQARCQKYVPVMHDDARGGMRG